jgi:hypothetical protein
MVTSSGSTVLLLYADAPPHMPCTAGSNRDKERTALSGKRAFGGFGGLFVDWVTACRTVAGARVARKAAEGWLQGRGATPGPKDLQSKKATVFCVIQSPFADTLA